jgi:hypothetical protein
MNVIAAEHAMTSEFKQKVGNGQQSEDRKSETQAQVQFAHRTSVRALRPAAGRLPQIQALPDLLPQAVSRRGRSRSEEGELVIS